MSLEASMQPTFAGEVERTQDEVVLWQEIYLQVVTSTACALG